MHRDELDRLIDILNERGALLNKLLDEHKQLQEEQRIQFQRIAQMQAELDLIRQAWTRLNLPSIERRAVARSPERSES